MLLPTDSTQCSHCNKAEIKENKNLKKKEQNLMIPAKLHAPIKNTAPERIKLTMQNIRLENKMLKLEIEQMKHEIEHSSIDIKDNSLHRDFVSIISNADSSKMPPFMNFFLGGVTKIPFIFQNWCSLSSTIYNILFRTSS